MGAAGGAVFHLFSLPLAWMLGAMLATTVAAFAGAPLRMWLPLRSGLVIVLGALLGSAFEPGVLARLGSWAGGLAVSGCFMAGITALVFVWFHRAGRFDAATAYFSATPGGMGVMAIIGEAYGGDPRTIPLVHATRILIVVFSIPFFVRYGLGFEVPASATFAADQPVAAGLDLLILMAGAVLGSAVATWLRVPAAQLVGAMVVSVALHLTGVVEGRPPTLLVALAQIGIGAMVGARFLGVRLSAVWRPVLFSAGSSLVMLGAAGATAMLAGPALGLAPVALLLALAPGGLAEMALIALALNYDTAFVSTMHIFRIMMIVLLAPAVFRLLAQSPPPPQ